MPLGSRNGRSSHRRENLGNTIGRTRAEGFPVRRSQAVDRRQAADAEHLLIIPHAPDFVRCGERPGHLARTLSVRASLRAAVAAAGVLAPTFLMLRGLKETAKVDAGTDIACVRVAFGRAFGAAAG